MRRFRFLDGAGHIGKDENDQPDDKQNHQRKNPIPQTARQLTSWSRFWLVNSARQTKNGLKLMSVAAHCAKAAWIISLAALERTRRRSTTTNAPQKVNRRLALF